MRQNQNALSRCFYNSLLSHWLFNREKHNLLKPWRPATDSQNRRSSDNDGQHTGYRLFLGFIHSVSLVAKTR